MSAEANRPPLLDQLRELLPELRERYGVATLEVFGSHARADLGQKRDLDLLVTFTETPDLLTFIGLENEIAERLEVPVDLVMRRALKARLRDRILGEAIRKLKPAESNDDPLYQEAREIGHRFQDGLDAIFFDDDEIARLTKIYGVF